jgi:MbtH protein
MVTIYKVVVNDEQQYSIWPEHRENPLGWRDAGKSGLKAECLAYIDEVWTDMRPLGLRQTPRGGPSTQHDVGRFHLDANAMTDHVDGQDNAGVRQVLSEEPADDPAQRTIDHFDKRALAE